ncbi:MAG: 1-acyl-sn-glycerol-3-phosphate acyltransferase [Chloroflexi bacterium]|nr:MAG: 1-acyl-sn-glycerol-3-phosphate acyltransferase [Chloroflexota bacterium]TME40501.1 MAG: 1-acyl-sn-glycerol-3-phosphate acyltransferase [Chloroflexota bacterium]
MMYALMRALVRFIANTYLVGLFRVEGLENVPRDGPLIVCANHAGTIDPPLVPAFLPRSDSWNMAKSEYFRGPVMRWLFVQYHAFPVIRHTADRAALRRSFDLLRAGQVLVIYPEGTRVDSGVLATPEPGAGFIAQLCGCPVLPVALTGTPECLPKGALWPRRVPVTIRYGKPLLLMQKRASGERVSHQEASDRIMLAIAELLPPEKRGAFTDIDSLRKRLGDVSIPSPLQGSDQSARGARP